MHPGLHLEPWYFIFVDIIYIGAIRNIGRVVTQCSSYSFIVYMTAASLLVIMFSTRFGFDVFFHSCEGRSEIYLPVIFVYNIGVMLMAFFIEMRGEESDTEVCQFDEEGYNLGGCYQCKTNSYGFAAGFILTRVVMILLYFVKFQHVAKQEHGTHEESKMGKDEFDSVFYITVYLISAAIVAGGFNSNFPQPFWLLAAAIVESLGGLGKDRLRVTYTVKNQPTKKDQEIIDELETLYKATASFYQSRLYTFYLLVLGEAVLGLVIIPMVTEKQGVVDCFTDLVMSYCIIFAVGYQYSVFTTATAERHVMSTFVGYKVRDWYIWLHVIAAFAILMASNAMEHIFDDTQLESCDPSEIDHHDEYANSLKLGVGLVTVWLCLMALRMLHVELDQDVDTSAIGLPYWQIILLTIIVTMVGHGIGSVPGLLPQNRLLVYHGFIVWIPCMVGLPLRIYFASKEEDTVMTDGGHVGGHRSTIEHPLL